MKLFIFCTILILMAFVVPSIANNGAITTTRDYPLKRFSTSLELGFTPFGADRNYSSFIFDITEHYNFNKIIALGVGFGSRFYTNYDRLTIPYFTDFKINFIKNRVSPFLNL